MKAIIALWVGVATGACMVWAFIPRPPQEKEFGPQTEAKLRGFAENELRAYAQAQDAEEKLRRADELYEKAVLLFLADLGLRVALPPKAPSLAELKSDAAGDVPMDEGGPKEVGSPSMAHAVTVPAPAPIAKKLTPEEAAIEQTVAFRRAPLADKMAPQVRRITGQFDGLLMREKGKRKGQEDTLNLSMDFSMSGDKLEGRILILMSDPSGKLYSRNSGEGKNQTVRLVPGSRDQVYIEPAPGDFILLNLARGDRMRGVYYEDGHPIGKVVIWRK